MTIDAPAAAIEAKILELFGEASLSYARNKHRGGQSGKKGTRYEDYFATLRVAEIAAEHVKIGGKKPDWPKIEGQAVGFVDDLVLSSVAETQHSQCKNSPSVTWSGGEHPIAGDFAMQHDLAAATGKPDPRMELVVSDSELAEKLRNCIPDNIEPYSSVRLFPYATTANRLVLEDKEIQRTLAHLTRAEEPELDELSETFQAILLSWIETDGQCSIGELLARAGKQSPQLLRTFPITDGVEHLSPGFVAALAAVNDLKYSVKRGFFSWYSSGTSGIFPHDCGTEEFARFQKRVIKNAPSNFDAFWDLL
ncbi:hypothetical protein [Cupriavidus malaysiensis]|uniref:hypothetical protein n=1 Tax=Cupriavidus malaysiensis TaxID=367825 RepID=UPI0012FF9B19|nr:hypothetical protein [Cupriavidus malaysiensis]